MRVDFKPTLEHVPVEESSGRVRWALSTIRNETAGDSADSPPAPPTPPPHGGPPSDYAREGVSNSSDSNERRREAVATGGATSSGVPCVLTRAPPTPTDTHQISKDTSPEQ